MRQLFISLLAYTLLDVVAVAQPGVDESTFAIITNAVIGVYGNGVDVSHVVNVDTAIGRHDILDGQIEDEHSLLTHAYIFAGGVDYDLGFVGIYRNNQIAWISDTVIRPSGSLQIFATRDMLHDGGVEIVVIGGAQGGGDISVFRWDGQTGTMISAVDELYPTMEFSGDLVRFADIEGDGILELQSYDSLDSLVTFGWNGQQYGKWPTTLQPLKTDYLPMNRFSASFFSGVNSVGGRLCYRYRVQNSSSSLQSVKEVVVKHRVDPDSIINQNGPAYWWGYATRSLYPSWENVRDQRYWDIMPGATDSSFAFSSSGLPAILPYYLLGRNAWSSNEDLNLWEQNVLTNSVHGSTVAPATPPSPFNGLTFLDTLKLYVTQSRTLGWITSDPTANKYKRLIDTARSYLQANIRGVTKTKLDSVLLNVYADSASTFTSEAYALIRFNTEYVLNKLREEDSTFAADNKSSSSDATASNSARHLVKTQSYLHEVFASGGEIFYCRSADQGSTWDQTYRINMAVGDNSLPCIATTQHASVEIVWQRRIAPSTYEVWHSYSQDDGASWSTPVILPDAAEVGVSGYQTDGTMPVVAELFGARNTLVAVYCSNEGLRYRLSEDEGARWQVPEQDTISGEFNDRVRFPSLAGGNSYMSLLYDYVDDDLSPYSRTFDGSSWSKEGSVGKGTGSDDGAFSSVAIDKDNNPIAVWSGIVNTWTRSIIFRAGSADKPWSNWFVAFGQGQFGPDWVSPSLTYYNRGVSGQFDIAIVNHSTASEVKLIRYTGYTEESPPEPPSWTISTLSESGVWPNITHDNYSSGNPICSWTDQSFFPYQVVVGSPDELSSAGGGILKMTNLSAVSLKRRAVVYHSNLRASLSVEFEPIKIVNASGDTSAVPFKAASLRDRGGITFSNMWDYLGSGVISVPANARRLVLTKQFTTRGPSIAKRKFFLRVLNANGVTIGLLDSTANSGTISVNIAQFAGMSVILRPQVTLAGIEPTAVAIGVGDVFTLPDEPLKRPQGTKKGLR
jgi:hypothetical protein